jgi:tetratricopeptide (TPR) repeat protein
LAIAAAALALTGCDSAGQKVNDEIDAGEVALGGSQYDLAVSHADEALHVAPSVRAYYVRARAEEDRPKPNAYISTADLTKARADYQAALDLRPDRALAARCHFGLGNVAFDQEDYAESVSQWNAALTDLDEAPWQADAQFRIGEAEQRQGHFAEADSAFQRVVGLYSDQEVADKARTRIGIRAFYLQVADCASTADAQTAINTAQTAGLACRQTQNQGLYAVRAGPYSTYAQAKAAQVSVSQQFPDAAIIP